MVGLLKPTSQEAEIQSAGNQASDVARFNPSTPPSTTVASMLSVWFSPGRVWEGRSIDVYCGLVGVAGGLGTRTGGAQGADRTCVRPGRSPGERRSLSRWRAVRGRAQNRLAPGRAGGSGSALPHAVALGAQPLGRGRAAGSRPR